MVEYYTKSISGLFSNTQGNSYSLINKFDRLYISEQGLKSIFGTIDGKNLKNLIIEYKGFGPEICDLINQYSISKKDAISDISCKNGGDVYYVLGQGSGLSGIDPYKIWPDLTSKLRVN